MVIILVLAIKKFKNCKQNGHFLKTKSHFTRSLISKAFASMLRVLKRAFYVEISTKVEIDQIFYRSKSRVLLIVHFLSNSRQKSKLTWLSCRRIDPSVWMTWNSHHQYRRHHHVILRWVRRLHHHSNNFFPLRDSPAPPSISPPPTISPSGFEPPTPMLLQQVIPSLTIEQRPNPNSSLPQPLPPMPLRVGIEFYYSRPLGTQALIERFPASIIFLDQELMHWFNTYVAYKKRGQHIQEYLDRALD